MALFAKIVAFRIDLGYTFRNTKPKGWEYTGEGEEPLDVNVLEVNAPVFMPVKVPVKKKVLPVEIPANVLVDGVLDTGFGTGVNASTETTALVQTPVFMPADAVLSLEEVMILREMIAERNTIIGNPLDQALLEVHKIERNKKVTYVVGYEQHKQLLELSKRTGESVNSLVVLAIKELLGKYL